jgi:hypothetical protein
MVQRRILMTVSNERQHEEVRTMMQHHDMQRTAMVTDRTSLRRKQAERYRLIRTLRRRPTPAA